jgi:hypothetical protein
MPASQETGPALLRAAAEPKRIFSLQKRRLADSIIRPLIQPTIELTALVAIYFAIDAASFAAALATASRWLP